VVFVLMVELLIKLLTIYIIIPNSVPNNMDSARSIPHSHILPQDRVIRGILCDRI